MQLMGLDQGSIESMFFDVYLDLLYIYLSVERNNIEDGCCIGEVLLNHLMFADDICLFDRSVRGLQSIQDVC